MEAPTRRVALNIRGPVGLGERYGNEHAYEKSKWGQWQVGVLWASATPRESGIGRIAQL